METGRQAQTRRWYEHLFDTDDGDVQALYAPDATIIQGGIARSPDLFAQLIRIVRATLVDPGITVHEMVEQGDLLAVRWTLHGVHGVGPAYGVEPNGAQVAIDGASFLRFAGDRVVENHDLEDGGAMMRQIGARPPGYPV